MVLCKSERRTEEKTVVVGYQYCILDFLKRGDDSLISEYRLIKECEIGKQGITRHQARYYKTSRKACLELLNDESYHKHF